MLRNKLTSFKCSRSNLLILKSMRKLCTSQSEVIIQNIGDKGVITLNRPHVLNALNVSMTKKILTVLKEWEQQKCLVIIKGAGEKAFCCGGDLKSFFEKTNVGIELWKYVYEIINTVGRYKIPYVAFIDGIVMGSGAGLSINGRYQIATERTIFAMPETRIGLFPDSGASYFLSRLKTHLGVYLALTGHRIKGPDVVKIGLATHYCNSKDLDELEINLLNCSSEKDINETLSKLNVNINDDKLALGSVVEKIDKHFSNKTVEEIILSLQEDGSKWAKDTINDLLKCRPFSLKVALREIELGQQLSFEECLNLEIRLISQFTKDNADDFKGMRTALVDKNEHPKWEKSLSEISDSYVMNFFQERPFNKLATNEIR